MFTEVQERTDTTQSTTAPTPKTIVLAPSTVINSAFYPSFTAEEFERWIQAIRNTTNGNLTLATSVADAWAGVVGGGPNKTDKNTFGKYLEDQLNAAAQAIATGQIDPGVVIAGVMTQALLHGYALAKLGQYSLDKSHCGLSGNMDRILYPEGSELNEEF